MRQIYLQTAWFNFSVLYETRKISYWIEKPNVYPIHKKGDKQILRNYRHVSLLPICGKFFELLICNSLFENFIENDLISQNQSGFKPGVSCINQLISITHEIYQSFDDGFKVRGVFLDMSKVLIKLGMKILFINWSRMDNLLDTLTNFLKDRKQRVVLNGQHSKWANIEAGVPLGLILSTLLFWYI